MRKVLLPIALVAGLVWLPSTASATATEGTWTLFPPQSETTTTGTAYKTVVRQPVNPNGTSNWPARRGVIPVQLDLQTAETMTTEYGDVLFQSIASDNPAGEPLFGTGGTFGDQSNDFAFLRFVPDTPFPFEYLTELSADYTFTMGDCYGGSLRWQVRLDVGNDEVTSNDGNIFVYYGAHPNFDDCTTADAGGVDSNQSGENMLTKTDARFDTGQLPGGTFYDTLASARTKYDDLNVLRASLVIDSGWVGCPDGDGDGSTFDPIPGASCRDQDLDPTNVTVNGNTFVPNADTTTTGDFTTTCELPMAAIEVVRNDPTPTGAANETPESIQLKDTGEYFRIVDCKYLYNLNIQALSGPGTYRVYANIGGTRVTMSPATFDLV